ncbi:hypothetical protein E4U53_006014 [Claviceps sorghi]|nr:hypothetical protein E4U53_006014 [Claviceps sorghi]
MAQHLGTSKSSQNLRASYAYHPHRLAASASSASLLLPHSASFQSFGNGSRGRSSGTWTTSSGELGLLNNADEVEDRDVFVQEYNRLAKKHGVRQLVTDDFEVHHRVSWVDSIKTIDNPQLLNRVQGEAEKGTEKRGWISRLLRPNPQRCSHIPSSTPPLPQIRHKRSVSELANVIHCRREPPRVIGLQEMVRLGGKSILYLPQDYSPCCLILPTCIRATAQHLAQNVATRGLFRVPGSAKVIGALFDYYCYMDHSNAKIASTVRCATLPVHIQYSTHDVASTFKRLLSVLPGGVLGSLSLFDAFIAIHSQLNGEPEYPRTKQTKVRARLIALAIGTVQSQQRRELICAVFGLLSLIGRTAEIAPREDEDGRPLPTADLMGYSALGIVFGPLLVGDLLEQYTMKVATPTSGMLLFPLSPPRFRRDRRKSIHIDCKEGGPPTVDRILVANDLTKMLISNWRDVVRQMKSLGAHCRKDASTIELPEKPGAPGSFHPAPGFNIKVPKGLDESHDRLFSSSQAPRAPNEQPEIPSHGPRPRRLKVVRRADSQRLLRKMSISTLSPTKEESLGDDESSDRQGRRESVIDRLQKLEKKGDQPCGGTQGKMNPQANLDGRNLDDATFVGRASRVPSSCGVNNSAEIPTMGASQVYLESVPPRESSRHASSHDDGRDSLSKRVVSEQSTASASLCSPHRESIATLEVQAQQRVMNGKLTSPNQAKGIAASRKRREASSTASANTKPLSEGGIRLVQTSPVPAVRSGGSKTDQGQECVEPGSASKPFVSHDQGIQCQIMTEQERRLSIDSTPERFYPFAQMSHVARTVTPDGGLLGHRNGAGKTHQKQPVLLHGPRLSKSDENLRSQTCITLQSPTTDSTEAKELTKKGSVKAMAALFELQPGWRETAASSTGIGAQSPRRSRHSKSDSAWTQRLDPLADLVQDDWRMESEDGDMELKSVPSLGTMVPCPERPPIAQHLNLARPPPSPSPVMEGKSSYSAPEMVSAVPVSRAGSATVLYSQIRKLQRQLDAKMEEAAQLRRQLEAQKDSDVGTLSEQLRQAKRDVAAWKDRAEAAERRVKVFETFTEKLREIRDAVAETRSHKPGKIRESLATGTGPGDARGGTRGDSAAAAKAIDAMKMIQESRQNSNKSEDQSTRQPNAQKRFPGLASSQDGADSHGPGSVTGEGASCDGGSWACQTLCGDRSGQIWAIVEELLQTEEERMTERNMT